jgi:predicted nucleic acid-binding protein
MVLTVVADTRFLLTFNFPPTNESKQKAANLMDESLRRGLLMPSIVVTEFIKLVGKRLGEEAALIFLKELTTRGATIVAIDEKIAVEAGKLALRQWDVPIADILIGATTLVHRAEHVVSDDQHFKQIKLKTKWL